MEGTTFKTNIKCAACVAKVTPELNAVAGEGGWSVALENPAKVLTVKPGVDEQKVREALEKVGYRGERL